jgi:hypothetical protein
LGPLIDEYIFRKYFALLLCIADYKIGEPFAASNRLPSKNGIKTEFHRNGLLAMIGSYFQEGQN